MIRYIVRADYAPAVHLTSAVICAATASALAPDAVPWQALPLEGLADLTDEETVDTGLALHTVSLTARLAAREALPAGPLAFRLTAADGSRWLMGTARRPYAVVVQTVQHPASPTEAAIAQLTATLTGPAPLLRLWE